MNTKALQVLITAGGTCEALDGVRTVTNTSTGATGACIAAYFLDQGAVVHLLHGRASVLPCRGETVQHRYTHEAFTSFSDLDARMRRFLGGQKHLDAVIHLAAVSDFSPVEIITADGTSITPRAEGKIASEAGYTVRFEPNRKIIDSIKEYAGTAEANHLPLVIGYKLTNVRSGEMQWAAIDALIQRGCCDVVVHNDLQMIDKMKHEASFYNASGQLLGRSKTKLEMAKLLYDLCFAYKKGDKNI